MSHTTPRPHDPSSATGRGRRRREARGTPQPPLRSLPWEMLLSAFRYFDDGLQRGLRPSEPPAPALALAALRWMASAAGYNPLRGLDPGCIELGNKLEAFTDFQTGQRLFHSVGDPRGLAAALGRAMSRGPYARLWTVEGVGHAYAEGADLAPSAAGLLRPGRVGTLPAAVLVPLHAGLGNAFAARLLDGGATTAGRVRALVDRFWDLCRRHALDGYAGVAFEGLGLAVRTLRPGTIDLFDRALADDGRRAALFWHGVGRGLYFTPGNLLPIPGGRWTALDQAGAEPRDERGRRNAVAGLAWALALVNVRHPAVVAARWPRDSAAAAPGASCARGPFARGPFAGGPFADGPFAGGAVAALEVWHRTHGRDAHLDRFLRHGESLTGAGERAAWRRRLTAPLLAALAQPPVPAEHLFTYPPGAGVPLDGAADAVAA